MIGAVLWVVLMIFILQLAVPSAVMRRDPTGNGMYYAVWSLLLIGVVTIHYHVMAGVHHGGRAIMLDGVALALFTLGRLGIGWLRWWENGGAHDESVVSSTLTIS